jgi:mono/diheme cytochrome c family protein
MKNCLLVSVFVAGSAGLYGCRGDVSADPPVHLVSDMDWQPKYLPEGESHFFADGRAMRPLVEGTIPIGHLDEDDAYFRGKSKDGQYIARIPAYFVDADGTQKPRAVDEKLLARGQERFGIYCTPCHSRTGDGHGTVSTRANWIAADLTADRVRTMSDGEVFNVITHGVRNNMPSYAAQIPVADRWAIIGWVRVLGRSQHAGVADVPAEMKSKIEPEETH